MRSLQLHEDLPIPGGGARQMEKVNLWDDDQPPFGPVFHLRANFRDINPPVKCRGAGCPVCAATRRLLRQEGRDPWAMTRRTKRGK